MLVCGCARWGMKGDRVDRGRRWSQYTQNMSRVLGRVRLSHDTDESTSVVRQREDLERWAQAHGYEIVGWAQDVDHIRRGGQPTRQPRPSWVGGCRDRRRRVRHHRCCQAGTGYSVTPSL